MIWPFSEGESAEAATQAQVSQSKAFQVGNTFHFFPFFSLDPGQGND